jgi:hypothetical protein
MFHTYIIGVLYRCCVCLQWFSSVFQVFQTHISSVSFVSFYMLQVLHLDVLKVDQILHMECAWEAGGGASGPCTGDVRAALALHGRAKRRHG